MTVYESIFEGENVANTKESTQTGDDRRAHPFSFRELPYSIETGEAEMISVDFVARGAGNAMAIESSTESGKAASKAATVESGGTKQEGGDANKTEESVVMSPENEECKFPIPADLPSILRV